MLKTNNKKDIWEMNVTYKNTYKKNGKKRVNEKCEMKDKFVIYDESQWVLSLPPFTEANEC